MNTIKKAKRLLSGPVFLRNKLEGVVIKSIPGEQIKFFVRFPGGKEYEIHPATHLVTDALLEWTEITEQKYKNF